MNIVEIISDTKDLLEKVQEEGIKAIDGFSSSSDELISIARKKIEGNNLTADEEKYWIEIIKEQIKSRRDIVIATTAGGLSMITIIVLAATGNLEPLIERGMLFVQKSSVKSV